MSDLCQTIFVRPVTRIVYDCRQGKWRSVFRVSSEEFYEALSAKLFEYNILPSDYKMHGPGKFFGYNQFFQLDPAWAATVQEHSGKESIFKEFLETANTDVLKNWE